MTIYVEQEAMCHNDWKIMESVWRSTIIHTNILLYIYKKMQHILAKFILFVIHLHYYTMVMMKF